MAAEWVGAPPRWEPPPAPSSLRAMRAGSAPPRPARLSSTWPCGAQRPFVPQAPSDRGRGRGAVGQGEAAGPPHAARSPPPKLPKDGEQRGCWNPDGDGSSHLTLLTRVTSLFYPPGPTWHGAWPGARPLLVDVGDRKSTRLNSSH